MNNISKARDHWTITEFLTIRFQIPDLKGVLPIPFKSVNRIDRIRYVEISVGRAYVNDDTGKTETDSGTHLIVFPYETQCGGSRFTSDPLIINYYRQFFMRLDEKVIDAKDGFLLCIIHVRKWDKYRSSNLPYNLIHSYQKIQKRILFYQELLPYLIYWIYQLFVFLAAWVRF